MSKETKRERFIRVAETRTNKIISMIKLLGNCATPTNYEYTKDDVKKIFDAIDKELKCTKNKFLGSNEGNEKFSLK